MSVEQYRINVVEFDFAGFINQNNTQVGAMVVESSKGTNIPIGVNGEAEVIQYFGTPSSDYSSLFEAIEYAKQNKLWLVSAYNTEQARYGGVDVYTTEVKGFGARAGRIYETFQNYENIKSENFFTVGVGNGQTSTYSGTITNVSLDSPIEEGSFKLKLGNSYLSVVESGGILTGSSLASPGTLNKETGNFTISLLGTAGTVAEITSSINGTSNFNLSEGSKNKAVNIIIDSELYENINLGNSANTTIASVITAINTAIGSTVVEQTNSSGGVGTGFFTFTGSVKDAVLGNITITDPSDTVTYDSALTIVFNASGNLIANGTNPTGSIPRVNQNLIIETITVKDQTANISHSFFALSPNAFVDQAVQISKLVSGDYKLRLYQKRSNNQYSLQEEYVYSLVKGTKDNFGRSKYVFDIFKNQTLIPYINENYVGVASPTNPTEIVDLTGGIRGGKPTSNDILNAWKNFENVNKYPVKNFMDVIGNSPATILDIRDNFQRQAFCLTTVPFGKTRTEAIEYRQSLSIDNDQGSLYAPWIKIKDIYNDSEAWTSRLGAVGVKYAEQNDFFDSKSPAGVDIAGDGGGQIESVFTPIEPEYDLKNESDFEEFDSNQINPIIIDPDYGLSIWGDKTLINANTDTSFVGTRRVYNLIIDRIKKQVLRQQIFKNNDEFHRLKAKTLCDDIIQPIADGEFINDFTVICDLTNNTDAVRNSRRFVVTVLIKATPNSQFVELKFVRLPQGVVLDSFNTTI